MPKKIEWTESKIAEPIPKKIILLIFLWFFSKDVMISLLYVQYLIKRYVVKNIAGLKIK